MGVLGVWRLQRFRGLGVWGFRGLMSRVSHKQKRHINSNFDGLPDYLRFVLTAVASHEFARDL